MTLIINQAPPRNITGTCMCEGALAHTALSILICGGHQFNLCTCETLDGLSHSLKTLSKLTGIQNINIRNKI